MPTETLILTQPDDWHLHVRTGAMLRSVIAHSARQFARAVIMPNLQPPVTTVARVLAYREEILQALPRGSAFQPLMTLYLTDQTTPEEIARAAESEHVLGCKLYPAGATTHSAAGVRDWSALMPVFAAMERHDFPLLIHGEVTDSDCDIFDRERVFIERHLIRLVKDFPGLRIVLEHVTTREGVQFVESAGPNVAATITPQHLLFNRNALLAGGVRPHHYCLPVLKRETHRQALITAATSGHPRFFLGTDSAPHRQDAKETACGCAGCYSAHAALELYATAFERAGALERLEAFASYHGADFYRLPRNTRRVELRRETWTVPDSYPIADGSTLVPLWANETLAWRFVT